MTLSENLARRALDLLDGARCAYTDRALRQSWARHRTNLMDDLRLAARQTVAETWGTATPQELCWSRGPRIGAEGCPYCKKPVGHEGLHEASLEDGWGQVTWGAPDMRRPPRGVAETAPAAPQEAVTDRVYTNANEVYEMCTPPVTPQASEDYRVEHGADPHYPEHVWVWVDGNYHDAVVIHREWAAYQRHAAASPVTPQATEMVPVSELARWKDLLSTRTATLRERAERAEAEVATLQATVGELLQRPAPPVTPQAEPGGEAR